MQKDKKSTKRNKEQQRGLDLPLTDLLSVHLSNQTKLSSKLKVRRARGRMQIFDATVTWRMLSFPVRLHRGQSTTIFPVQHRGRSIGIRSLNPPENNGNLYGASQGFLGTLTITASKSQSRVCSQQSTR